MFLPRQAHIRCHDLELGSVYIDFFDAALIHDRLKTVQLVIKLRLSVAQTSDMESVVVYVFLEKCIIPVATT